MNHVSFESWILWTWINSSLYVVNYLWAINYVRLWKSLRNLVRMQFSPNLNDFILAHFSLVDLWAVNSNEYPRGTFRMEHSGWIVNRRYDSVPLITAKDSLWPRIGPYVIETRHETFLILSNRYSVRKL